MTKESDTEGNAGVGSGDGEGRKTLVPASRRAGTDLAPRPFLSRENLKVPDHLTLSGQGGGVSFAVRMEVAGLSRPLAWQYLGQRGSGEAPADAEPVEKKTIEEQDKAGPLEGVLQPGKESLGLTGKMARPGLGVGPLNRPMCQGPLERKRGGR